jgi:toxin HigB-1
MIYDCMKIRNVIHKGLRKLIEDDNAAGLQPAVADKLRKIVSFLQVMEHEDALRSISVWKAHQLTGNRKGVWSLFVTKNWRITFSIDKGEIEIIDLDYEDYH